MSADATQRAVVAAPGFAALARRHWPWPAAIVAALLLPWLFFDWSTHRHSGFALTMLSEIGLMSEGAGPSTFGSSLSAKSGENLFQRGERSPRYRRRDGKKPSRAGPKTMAVRRFSIADLPRRSQPRREPDSAVDFRAFSIS